MADKRAFILVVTSFGSDLSSADRMLDPSCGKLYPEGLQLLAKAEAHEQVKSVASCYSLSMKRPDGGHGVTQMSNMK